MSASLPPDLDLDLDAVLAAQHELGPGLRFQLRGERYLLPAGLPVAAFAPLMRVLPPLMRILAPFLREKGLAATQNPSQEDTDALLLALGSNPEMPAEVLDALLDTAKRIFNAGEAGQWERFMQAGVTFAEVPVLIRAAWRFYGVTLGELFRSASSSGAGGATSNVISAPTEAPTPETSSETPETPVSSASAA